MTNGESPIRDFEHPWFPNKKVLFERLYLAHLSGKSDVGPSLLTVLFYSLGLDILFRWATFSPPSGGIFLHQSLFLGKEKMEKETRDV